MAEFAWWLALGLANLANIFDPQAFVIGGGLVAAGSVLFDHARAAFDLMLPGQEHRPEVAILPAALGPRAGAVGAAFLIAEELPMRSARVGHDDR
jgi:glucokinase